MKKTLMGAVAGAAFAFLAFSLSAPDRVPGSAEARTESGTRNSNVYKQLDLFSDVFDQVR